MWRQVFAMGYMTYKNQIINSMKYDIYGSKYEAILKMMLLYLVE